jgi:hypothetical protein
MHRGMAEKVVPIAVANRVNMLFGSTQILINLYPLFRILNPGSFQNLRKNPMPHESTNALGAEASDI